MLSHITEFIDSHWDDWFNRKMPALRWAILQKTVNHAHDNMIFYAYGERELPLLVAKSCRQAKHAAAIYNEYKMMESAWAAFGTQAQDFLAHPLALVKNQDDVVLLTTFVPGIPMAGYLQAAPQNNNQIKRHFQEAAIWLGQLHGHTRSNRNGEMPADFSVKAHTFAQLFKLSKYEKKQLEQLTLAVLRTQANNATAVQLHGDFWPGNCIWDEQDSRIRVVDWQFSRMDSEIGLDLYLFLLATARELSPSRKLKVQTQFMSQILAAWQKEIMPAFIAQYQQQLPSTSKLNLLPPALGLRAACVELATRPYLTYGRMQPDSHLWQHVFLEIENGEWKMEN